MTGIHSVLCNIHYIAMFYIRKQIRVLNYLQLFEKKNIIKICNWSIHSTRVPQMEGTVSLNGPYA